MDRFWNILMPLVFGWAFVTNLLDESWITAFWMAIAAGWYTLYRVNEWLTQQHIEYLESLNLTDYSK